MQAVWSRAARPQITCRCFNCANALPGVLSRRTVSAPPRRRLTFKDAFALLLTPVFGTAFVVDTSWKDKRRREWDERIAEVEGEVEEIRAREERILNSLRKGDTQTQQRLGQIRRFTSAAVDVAVEHGEETGIEFPDWCGFPPPASADLNLDAQGSPKIVDKSNENENVQEADQGALDVVRRIQRLAAIKMAIRLILHIHVGNNARFADVQSQDHDSTSLPDNLRDLGLKLKQIQQGLRTLSSHESRPRLTSDQKILLSQPSATDHELAALATHFKAGHMPVSELVGRINQLVLQSADPPSSAGYTPLLHALSQKRLNEMGYMVATAMCQSGIPLNKQSIFHILWLYGRNKDSYWLDKFIRSLVDAEGYVVAAERWVWNGIDGTQVVLPQERDPRIMEILIYGALKCDQPHKAEAWAKLLHGKNDDRRWMSRVIENFLRYCAYHMDWRKGREWLIAASDRIPILARYGIVGLQRVVMAMLELCVACRKRQLYTDILQAAIDARLDVSDLRVGKKNPTIIRIHAEWSRLLDAVAPGEEKRLFDYKRASELDSRLAFILDASDQMNPQLPMFDKNVPRHSIQVWEDVKKKSETSTNIPTPEMKTHTPLTSQIAAEEEEGNGSERLGCSPFTPHFEASVPSEPPHQDIPERADTSQSSNGTQDAGSANDVLGGDPTGLAAPATKESPITSVRSAVAFDRDLVLLFSKVDDLARDIYSAENTIAQMRRRRKVQMRPKAVEESYDKSSELDASRPSVVSPVPRKVSRKTSESPEDHLLFLEKHLSGSTPAQIKQTQRPPPVEQHLPKRRLWTAEQRKERVRWLTTTIDEAEREVYVLIWKLRFGSEAGLTIQDGTQPVKVSRRVLVS